MSRGRPARLAREFFAALSAIVLLAPPALATTVQRLDTRELTTESQDIVVGQVENIRPYWNASRTRILTEVTVRVARTLKGEAGERLVLTQLGGELDGIRYAIPGCAVFRPGEEALLFVWRDSQGRAQVNGLAQGKFEVRRDPVTGDATVERALPGLRFSDAKTLRPVTASESPRPVRLAELVREIERTLSEEAGR